VFLCRKIFRFDSCMAHAHDIFVRKLNEHSRLHPADEAALGSLGVRTRRLEPDEDLIREVDEP